MGVEVVLWCCFNSISSGVGIQTKSSASVEERLVLDEDADWLWNTFPSRRNARVPGVNGGGKTDPDSKTRGVEPRRAPSFCVDLSSLWRCRGSKVLVVGGIGQGATMVNVEVSFVNGRK